jgi:hypothetical protein
MTRPSGFGLFLSALIAAVFTLLVALDTLGAEWLILGPAIGAAVEIVGSHLGGMTGSVGASSPSGSPTQGAGAAETGAGPATAAF